jgi:nicotinamidase-related amidase
MITLPASSTALILVDLQNGIIGMPLEPHSGEAVVSVARTLAGRFRDASAPVVLVNVDFSPDYADALKTPVDQSWPLPPEGFPKGWSDIIDGLAGPADIRITKRQWGAFYGTELDLQLRRRGVNTVVIGGVATNIGVESTARAAHEHGYAVVVVEDACAGQSAAMHAFAFTHIMPRLGRVATADDFELKR